MAARLRGGARAPEIRRDPACTVLRHALLALLALAACASPPENTPADAPPIDHERVSLADAVGWPLQRSIRADLDGDGTDERLVVASDVAVDSAGVPMWEDGHHWAAYVVDAPEAGAPEADSSRTLLYGAFLPMGRAEVAVTEPSVGGPPRVFVLSRSVGHVTAENVAYDGPGEARGLGSATFSPLTWVPAP